MSIELNNESGLSVDEELVFRVAGHTLRTLFIHPDAELAILFVDEAHSEELHVKWLDEPGPTDVMSFPMDELRPGTSDMQTQPGLLGDLVLCPQVAARQAEAAGHSLSEELCFLTVHGILHLLGYDHAEPGEKLEMFGIQDQILLSFWEHEQQGA